MLNKTSLIFREDVKTGYKHYIEFIRHWTMVISSFEKMICPVGINTTIDVNSDLIKMKLLYENPNDEWLPTEWEEFTTFLKKENFDYLQSEDEWAVYIHIDNFVETILSKPELYEW